VAFSGYRAMLDSEINAREKLQKLQFLQGVPMEK
jgi:hypothetical protein